MTELFNLPIKDSNSALVVYPFAKIDNIWFDQSSYLFSRRLVLKDLVLIFQLRTVCVLERVLSAYSFFKATRSFHLTGSLGSMEYPRIQRERIAVLARHFQHFWSKQLILIMLSIKSSHFLQLTGGTMTSAFLAQPKGIDTSIIIGGGIELMCSEKSSFSFHSRQLRRSLLRSVTSSNIVSVK